MKKKVNVIKLLTMIIKIIGVVIETFRDDTENEEVEVNDEQLAETLARLSTHNAMLTELCRQECKDDKVFEEKYAETITNFLRVVNPNVSQEKKEENA